MYRIFNSANQSLSPSRTLANNAIGLPIAALMVLLWIAIFAAGCDRIVDEFDEEAKRKVIPSSDGKLTVVTTTGMIRDMVVALVRDDAHVYAMMGAGTDPHLYQPNRGDMVRVLDADVVVYNGLHLEGRLGEVLERRNSSGGKTIAIGEVIPREVLMDADAGVRDPHLWMDVSIWSQAIEGLARDLGSAMVVAPETLSSRVKIYQDELDDLDRWGAAAIATIPENQRVLVTAHDAFRYFGRRYGIAVHGVQGVSTASEAAISDVNRLVSLIVKKKIPAIFVETSVSDKQVKAIVEGARQKNIDVTSNWTLYSDSMGADGTPGGTYIGMMKHNFRTITEALGGNPDVPLPPRPVEEVEESSTESETEKTQVGATG